MQKIDSFKIAVAIPVHNRLEMTMACLKQLTECFDGYNYTFIVIDDGSTDGTATAVKEAFPSTVILLGDGNLWWSGAVEKARSYVLEKDFTHLLVVNDDLIFDKSFVRNLLEASEKYPNALVGGLKLNSEDMRTVLVSGYRANGVCQQLKDVFIGMSKSDISEKHIEVDTLPGSSLLLPVSVAKENGPFDVARYPHNFGDLEYTLRASKAGFQCIVRTDAIVFTELNQNYLNLSYNGLTRKEFIKNVFNRYKYNYGYVQIYRRAYMHKSFLCGTYWFVRLFLS